MRPGNGARDVMKYKRKLQQDVAFGQKNAQNLAAAHFLDTMPETEDLPFEVVLVGNIAVFS